VGVIWHTTTATGHSLPVDYCHRLLLLDTTDWIGQVLLLYTRKT